MSGVWRELWLKLRLAAWWLLADREERRSVLNELAAAQRRRAWKARLLAAESARLAAHARELADGCSPEDGDAIEDRKNNSQASQSSTDKGGFP
jgi:hypothetical protein